MEPSFTQKHGVWLVVFVCGLRNNRKNKIILQVLLLLHQGTENQLQTSGDCSSNLWFEGSWMSHDKNNKNDNNISNNNGT